MILLANVHHMLHFLAFFLLVLRPWYLAYCKDYMLLWCAYVHSFVRKMCSFPHSLPHPITHTPIFMCVYPPCYTLCFYESNSMTNGQSSEIITMLGSCQEVWPHWGFSLWPSSVWILSSRRVCITLWAGIALVLSRGRLCWCYSLVK